jgi:hypothetical protein
MDKALTVQFRPMDMRLTVRDFQDVDELAEPEELKAYLDQLLKLLVYLSSYYAYNTDLMVASILRLISNPLPLNR